MNSAQKLRLRSKANPSLVPVTRPLQQERIQLLLRKLPEWKQSKDGAYLTRTFSFADPGVQLALVGFIAALAVQEGHFLALALREGAVDCLLTTMTAGGPTTQDFDLARKISCLV